MSSILEQYEVDEICRHCGKRNPDPTVLDRCSECGMSLFRPRTRRPTQPTPAPTPTASTAYLCFGVPLTISLCILIVQLINNLNTRDDFLGNVFLVLQMIALPLAFLWPWIGLLIWRTTYQPKRRDTGQREPMGRAASIWFVFSLSSIPLAILVTLISMVGGAISHWS